MSGYAHDIERQVMRNEDFRRVVHTSKASQVSIMTIKPGQETGKDAQLSDLFVQLEQGNGEIVIGGEKTLVRKGFGALVPGGVEFNLSNTGSVPMKLYSIHTPPHFMDGAVHLTQAASAADKAVFDGVIKVPAAV
jgi:mannose-6-phosphate isomerase-like protein (cupin superfamily)